VTLQRDRKNSSRLERYALNALWPSSVWVSKVGLRKLPLLRSDPLWLEVPPFLLDVFEVVESPSGVAKICCHMNRIGAGSSYSKQEKQDYPIW
jgi:hypothetical protein